MPSAGDRGAATRRGTLGGAARYNALMPLKTFAALTLATLSLLLSGASAAPQREVTIYFTVDDPFAAPILKRFETETGIHVVKVTDSETSKTASLAERLEAEKNHPRADVYWGNEPYHTINLANADVFDPYRPKPSEDVPAKWRDKGDRWVAMGLRARMLAISTRDADAGSAALLRGVSDFSRPELKGKLGICNAAFGTASGHFAALYCLWGEAKFTETMKRWRANDVKLLGSNSAVADQVAAGNLIGGLTDNDDCDNAIHEGGKLNAVLPDQDKDAPGTLLIPATLSLVHAGPNPEAAKKLIDYLAAPKVEQELIVANFLAYPVRSADKVKTIDVNLDEAAGKMRHAVELALTILQGR